MPVSPSDLKEAYSANTAYVNLAPTIIDRALQEGSRKWSPLSRALPRKTWLTLQYKFNQRQQLPASQMTTKNPIAGQVKYTGSNFQPFSYNIKNMEADLSVAKVDQQVATVNGSIYDLELQGAAESMKRLEDVMHIWGNENATLASLRPQWNGVDQQIAQNSQNRQTAANSLVSFTVLDNIIDVVKTAAAQELGDDYFLLMSAKMQSALGRQLTSQQRFDKELTRIFSRTDFGDPEAEPANNYLDAGVEVATYRNIPLILSSFMSSVGQMSTVTAAAAGSGSQLATATYYYMVEAITRHGVTQASAEVSQAATSGQNVTLTWTTPTILDIYLNPIDIFGYRIYRSSTTLTESLYALVSALDGSDNPIVTFVDNGTPSVPVAGTPYTNCYTTVAANVGGTIAQPNGLDFPRYVGTAGQNPESIYLIPRNPDFCVVPVLNEPTPIMLAPTLARSSQFALTADMCLALRNGAFAAKVDQVRTI
jgi:hypothetical protein